MKKILKLGSSGILISLFALFIGKKLDDRIKISRQDTPKDRGVEKLD